MWSTAYSKWRKLQVNHSGKYSLARLEALDAYCKSASPLRALLVCCLTPLPALAFVLAIECVPLKAPEEGWRANYMMWLRFWVTTVVMTQSLISEGRAVIPELPMSWKESLVIAMVTNAFDLIFLMITAAKSGYPIPFMFVALCGPYGFTLAVCIAIWVRMQPYERIRDPKRRIKLFLGFLTSVVATLIIYPVYSAIYTSLEGLRQLSFTLVLFLIKLVMKNLMAGACRSDLLNDFVPEITIFTVDLFHSLFVMACIKTGGSSSAVTMLIVVLDVFQSFLALRGIRSQETKVVELLSTVMSDAPRDPRDLMTKCLELCRADADRQASAVHAEQVEISGARAKNASGSAITTRADQRKIHPANCIAGSSAELISSTPCADIQVVIDATLHVFFNCEYLVLLEYLECVIPLVYVAYTAALVHLPNAAYFPESKDITASELTSTAASILALAGLEVLTLVGFCVVVKKAFNLPALYQLAFVLETQRERIQGKLFTWITFSLFFSLQHYGADFSLKFAWMKTRA